MINHPILAMRDPPPEIDVTRPALPKREPSWNEYMCIEPIAEGLTESAGCTRSHPHENMSAECERKTIAARAVFESAATGARIGGVNKASGRTGVQPVAADQFKEGDDRIIKKRIRAVLKGGE